MNTLNIQGYQNAYHRHSFTPGGSISVTTNPTFTGSEVTSNANNRGHSHTINHGHTAQAYYASSGGSTGFEWHGSGGSSGSNPIGRIVVSDYSGSSGDESQSHTHKVTANGTISGGAYTFSGTASNTGYNGDSSIKEARPSNYTIKIWKRTA